MKIREYRYLAYDREGRQKEGAETAASQEEALAALRARGLIPVSLTVESGRQGFSRFAGRPKAADLIEFTDGLSTLVAAHVPLDKALTMLEEATESPNFKKVVNGLRREVKEGKSLNQAMEASPDHFSPMYRNMVRAGEEGGILELLLPRLLRLLEENSAIRRQVVNAMIYPAILLTVGIVSIILILLTVVPGFTAIFEDAGTPIPPAAAFLLALSNGLASYGWLLPAIPIPAWYLWRKKMAEPGQRFRWDRLLLRLPLAGEIILYLETAAFGKTLGALLTAGIPLLKGLRISEGVVNNLYLRQALRDTEKEVRGGRSLGLALAEREIFPRIFAQLVVIGEESGKTPVILNRLGENCERQARQRISRLMTMLEPLLILLLGFFVGGIVMIMLTAVFSLNEVSW